MKAHNHDLTWDFDRLVHPSQVFEHPRDVVSDPDLTLNEKRAILASWASDACAIEAAPELRAAGANIVRWDDIMDALRCLDREGEKYGKPLPHYKRVLAGRSALTPALVRSRKRTGEGQSLN